MLAVSIHLTVMMPNIQLIYIVGAVLQVLCILFVILKMRKH